MSAYPVIPADEYPLRWGKVHGLMSDFDLDLVVAYGDDRAVFGPAHIRWLADFPVHFEPAMFLLARGGEPMLVCGPESPGYASRVAKVTDVRILREFTHPDEDYPFSRIQSFSEIVEDASGKHSRAKRIGLAGGGLIGAVTMAALRAALPEAEWIDIEAPMCKLRAIKTPAEIAVIRHAYEIAHDALMAGIAVVGEGVREREINAAIDAAMWTKGGEGPGIATTITSGAGSASILGRSTFRKVEKDEHVMITVAPRYEGYHAAIGRAVFVGSPREEVCAAHAAAQRAAEACAALLRPDIEGSHVEGIGRKIMAEAGLADYFPYSGIHSIGVIEFEPPIFGPSAKGCFEEGMAISIDIPVFNAPWGGLRFEDGYLITASGAEKLHATKNMFRK